MPFDESKTCTTITDPPASVSISIKANATSGRMPEPRVGSAKVNLPAIIHGPSNSGFSSPGSELWAATKYLLELYRRSLGCDIDGNNEENCKIFTGGNLLDVTKFYIRKTFANVTLIQGGKYAFLQLRCTIDDASGDHSVRLVGSSTGSQPRTAIIQTSFIKLLPRDFLPTLFPGGGWVWIQPKLGNYLEKNYYDVRSDFRTDGGDPNDERIAADVLVPLYMDTARFVTVSIRDAVPDARAQVKKDDRIMNEGVKRDDVVFGAIFVIPSMSQSKMAQRVSPTCAAPDKVMYEFQGWRISDQANHPERKFEDYPVYKYCVPAQE